MNELSVKAALSGAVEQLRGAGVESAVLDASLIIAESLGVERVVLYREPERVLTKAQETAARTMLERRAAREPLAYILGRREFFGLEFEVTPDVLIPRPETEHLVEHALGWLAARERAAGGASDRAGSGSPPEPRLADVGTGSGAIAVAAASNSARGRWIATDISAAALAVARRNAEQHGVADRIEFRQGHLLEPLDAPVDLICSNPPYVATRDRATLEPEVARWEPAAALFAGEDGLDVIRELIRAAPEKLLPGGLMLVEIGEGQAAAVEKLIRASGRFDAVRITPDLAGILRVVEGVKR